MRYGPTTCTNLKKEISQHFWFPAVFSSGQVYFKWYGGFMRKALHAFDHFFVQDRSSKKILGSQGFQNVAVSGDTRFDRVNEILNRDNTLDFMEAFSKNSFCLVAGSSWPEDETILVDYINGSELDISYVIAPHNIKKGHIQKLKASLTKKTVCYSEIQNSMPSEAQVLIVDTIGLLTKIYHYADLAYVGGGFATGLHNTLEPAIFGVPVLIGPDYERFKEVSALVNRGGVIPINNLKQFTEIVGQFFSNDSYRTQTGNINGSFIQQNTGATNQIISHIAQFL